MSITASQVQQLRQETSAGLMDCKRALEAAGGDMAVAKDELRKKGIAKADKKSTRATGEGHVVVRLSDDAQTAVLLEVNCETDFVAREGAFGGFVETLANEALSAKPADLEALLAMAFEGDTVEAARHALVAKVGENVQIKRFELVEVSGEESLVAYLHGQRIGVLVHLAKADDALGADMAMHIAAMNPLALSEDELDTDWIAKEKDIFLEQAKQSGKPEAILEKIVAGKMKKLLQENTLLGQAFVKDTDVLVSELLKHKGNSVCSYKRFELGA